MSMLIDGNIQPLTHFSLGKKERNAKFAPLNKNQSHCNKFKMKRILFLLVLLAPAGHAVPQQNTPSCTLSFAQGQTWNGGLKRNGVVQQITSSGFTIVPDTGGGFKISDLSAGFFIENDIPDQKLNFTINFDCFDVVAATYATPYGPCKVISGQWDDNAKQLTIHWTIEYNQVDETSVFTLAQ